MGPTSAVRFPAEVSVALDAAAAAEAEKASRSELIRRIVVEWLKGRGFLPRDPATSPAAEQDHADREVRAQAKRDTERRNEAIRRGQ